MVFAFLLFCRSFQRIVKLGGGTILPYRDLEEISPEDMVFFPFDSLISNYVFALFIFFLTSFFSFWFGSFLFCFF